MIYQPMPLVFNPSEDFHATACDFQSGNELLCNGLFVISDDLESDVVYPNTKNQTLEMDFNLQESWNEIGRDLSSLVNDDTPSSENVINPADSVEPNASYFNNTVEQLVSNSLDWLEDCDLSAFTSSAVQTTDEFTGTYQVEIDHAVLPIDNPTFPGTMTGLLLSESSLMDERVEVSPICECSEFPLMSGSFGFCPMPGHHSFACNGTKPIFNSDDSGISRNSSVNTFDSVDTFSRSASVSNEISPATSRDPTPPFMSKSDSTVHQITTTPTDEKLCDEQAEYTFIQLDPELAAGKKKWESTKWETLKELTFKPLTTPASYSDPVDHVAQEWSVTPLNAADYTKSLAVWETQSKDKIITFDCKFSSDMGLSK
ncbi:hypothetical protein V1512DRAFT_252884 [Lipomyces arxii]|uniref:uncharacterized protein n=1 Tax=Lipomyces arxii TaxID=56418 RepID=UPI0034CE3A90